MKKAILYINQFFGQIGGEEKAGIEPEIHESQIGPAMQLEKELNISISDDVADAFINSNTKPVNISAYNREKKLTSLGI